MKQDLIQQIRLYESSTMDIQINQKQFEEIAHHINNLITIQKDVCLLDYSKEQHCDFHEYVGHKSPKKQNQTLDNFYEGSKEFHYFMHPSHHTSPHNYHHFYKQKCLAEDDNIDSEQLCSNMHTKQCFKTEEIISNRDAFMKNCKNSNSTGLHAQKKIFQSPINRVNQYINYENLRKSQQEKFYQKEQQSQQIQQQPPEIQIISAQEQAPKQKQQEQQIDTQQLYQVNYNNKTSESPVKYIYKADQMIPEKEVQNKNQLPGYQQMNIISQSQKQISQQISKQDSQKKKGKLYYSAIIEENDYFNPNCQTKLLYFFQDNSTKFHYIDLDQISAQKEIKFQQIDLNIHFKIPIYHRSVITPLGDIYLVGGLDPNSKQTAVRHTYKLNIDTNELDKMTLMNSARHSFGIAYSTESIYAVGGITSFDTSPYLAECERYDISQKKWFQIAPLNQKSAGCCLAVYDNLTLFKFGGKSDAFTYNNFIEKYDVQINNWEIIQWKSELDNKIEQLPSFSACIKIQKNEILIFGGNLQDNQNSKESYLVKVSEVGNRKFNLSMSRAQDIGNDGTFWSLPLIQNNSLFAIQNVVMENNSNISYFGKKKILLLNLNQNQEYSWKIIQ